MIVKQEVEYLYTLEAALQFCAYRMMPWVSTLLVEFLKEEEEDLLFTYVQINELIVIIQLKILYRNTYAEAVEKK